MSNRLGFMTAALLLCVWDSGAGQHQQNQGSVERCTDGAAERDGSADQCATKIKTVDTSGVATDAGAFAVLTRRLLDRHAARGLDHIQLARTVRGRGLIATRRIRKGDEIFTIKLNAAIDCGETPSTPALERSPAELPVVPSGYTLALRAMRSGNYTEYHALPSAEVKNLHQLSGADLTHRRGGQVLGGRAARRGRLHAARVLDKVAAPTTTG